MTAFTATEVREMKRRLGVNSAAMRSAGVFSAAAHTHAQADVTGLTTALTNRAVLDASNTHTGTLDTFEQVHANVGLSTDGALTIEEGSIDATLLTGIRAYQLPDAAGVLLVDAPSDGKYYVRRNGAWVEIIP